MATTAERIQQQFGATASAYASSAVHAGGADLDALVAAAALTGTERVLDMGSGAGHTALALAAKGAAEVIGLDVTPEMTAVASGLAAQRGLTNVRFETGTVMALPYEDASFDLVTSRYSAHHYADPAAAFREAKRVLKPGGRVLMIDTIAPEQPALDTFLQTFELLRDSSHVRNCRATEWLRIFAAAGLAEPKVLYRGEVVLDGGEWVKRMQTPPEKVAIIRQLFAEATAQQRAGFDIRDTPWGFTQPLVLIEARA